MHAFYLQIVLSFLKFCSQYAVFVCDEWVYTYPIFASIPLVTNMQSIYSCCVKCTQLPFQVKKACNSYREQFVSSVILCG